MQQIIHGGTGANLPTAATGYAYLYGLVSATDATITNRTQLVPAAGIMRHLRVVLSAAPGAGTSYAFTLMVNGIASALTCTISNTDTSAEDITNSVTLAAGDKISMRVVPTGTPTGRTGHWGLVSVPTAPVTATCSGGLTGNTTGTSYTTLGSSLNSWNATQANRAAVWNINATITALYVEIDVAPGATKSRAYTIMKNGVAEASSTVTISEAGVTASITGLSIDLAPGDTLSLRHVPTNTPTAKAATYFAMAYTPDIDGEYCLTGIDQNDMGATSYHAVTQYASGWQGTNTAFNVKAGAASTSILPIVKSIRGLLLVAPGAGTSRALTLQVDSAASALTVSIANTDTTGVATTTISPTVDQLLNVSNVRTGAAAASGGSIALLMFGAAGAGGGPGNSGNAPGRGRGNPNPGGGSNGGGNGGGGPVSDPTRRAFRSLRRRTR